MNGFAGFTTITIVLFAFLGGSADAHEKFTPNLNERLEFTRDVETILAWVYFTDKNHPRSSFAPAELVSERSIQRRLKVRTLSAVVDETDFPLSEHYVSAVSENVRTVRHRSKWLNAVSVSANREQLQRIADLPFVRMVDAVARFARNDSEHESGIDGSRINENTQEGALLLDYGTSFNQVNQINVPAVHNTGNYGQGILVGVFDNGFRLPNHEAFASMSILATYDFVDYKVSVVPRSPSHGAHGVNTLSAIGGYKPGQLIGPAFGATFILARTENDSSETPAEEDKWVAAIEWADSIGVDVTSTSLGYLTYDAPYPSWTWQNMDGNTTVITRAADLAVARGILVFNSAGNEGSNASRNTLIAPADGDSVIAVGSVTSTGARSSFSSVGPTTSIPPRIKPDIMARGSSVVLASSSNPLGYTTASGTSFSCPLAAGAATLVLKAHPWAAPMQILAALKATASNSLSPNNQMGWGIINTEAAINYLTANNVQQDDFEPSGFVLGQNYPNPFNPETTIPYTLSHDSFVSLVVYDLLGREVITLVKEQQGPGSYRSNWNGQNYSGGSVSSGTYIYRFTVSGVSGSSTLSRRMLLLQ